MRRPLTLLLALLAGCASPGDDPTSRVTAAVDTDCGRLLVSDRAADVTYELDACTGEMIREHGDVRAPSAAVRAPDGRLFVTSFATGAVHCGEAEPFYRDTLSLQEPVAMAWRDGALWVLGRDTRHFVVLSPAAGELDLVGGPELDRAHDFAFADDGRVYVATSWNGRTEGRIQVWRGGELDGSFGPELSTPTGVALGPDGFVYVAEWGGDHVVRFDLDGALDPSFEIPVTAPLGLAVGPEGALFVTSDGAVLRFDADGERALLMADDPRSITYVAASSAGPS